MNTRDLALAICDALECSTIITHSENEDGDLIESGAVFIDHVDVSDPSNIALVDEMGNRYFVHVVAAEVEHHGPTYWDNGEARPMHDVRDYWTPKS